MSGILDKFRKLFKRDGYYSWGTLKYLLYVYDINDTLTPSEQKLNPSDYFKQDPKDSYSVEHIYPQKAINEYWTQRFNVYSEKERKLLSSSLGNMLPLSKRINSRLQNNSFIDKKNRYNIGSRSEQKVAEYQEWTPEVILNRGIEILNFIETEWDFKFPNLAEKKKLLGLEFMINENDYQTDLYIPEYKEDDKPQREIIYDEEQFKKLSSITDDNLMNIFYELDNYILSLNENIKKNTTTVYLGYSYETNFISLWFQKNRLKYVIMTGGYDDPNGLVIELSESYQWSNDRCIMVDSNSDIEYIKSILKQSFEKQFNR